MIFRRLRSFNKEQAGLTLIELITSLAITGLIATGVTTSIAQVMLFHDKPRDTAIASQEVQNCGYWISQDTLRAQVVQVGDDSDSADYEVLNLYWVGWERTDAQDYDYFDSYEVRYVYDSQKLWRHEQIKTEKYDPAGQLINITENQKTTFVGEHITDLAISYDDNMLTVLVTASVGEDQSQKTYEIAPRAIQ